MLNRIEQKLTALIADALVSRPHISVIQPPRRSTSLNPGEEVVLVSLSEMTRSSRFERETLTFNGAESRRVLPVDFSARIDFFLRASGNSVGQLAAARNLMLEDISLVGYRLSGETVANGRDFAVADPDPGFRVRGFALETGNIERDAVSQVLSGYISCAGNADIWPSGVAREEGEILGIDTILTSLPLAVTVHDAVAGPGENAVLRVRSLPAQRKRTLEPPASDPLQLAVTVAGDLPPNQRGTILEGAPGLETGFRIIDVTPPETAITYQAPVEGITETRVEYVAIHLAKPDLHSGIFLGSTAVRLEPGQ